MSDHMTQEERDQFMLLFGKFTNELERFSGVFLKDAKVIRQQYVLHRLGILEENMTEMQDTLEKARAAFGILKERVGKLTPPADSDTTTEPTP